MYIPAIQRGILQEILEDFQFNYAVDDLTLGNIYQYIFSLEAKTIQLADTGLLEIVMALKDIAEMEQITTLEGIKAFFKVEDQAIDECVQDIKNEISASVNALNDEAEMTWNEDNSVLVEQTIAVRPALSRYFVSTEHYKNKNFLEVSEQEWPWLHRFFRFHFQKVSVERNALIKDCIQDVLIRTWESYQKSVFEKLSIKELIRKYAKDIANSQQRMLQKNGIVIPLEEIPYEIPYSFDSQSYEIDYFLLEIIYQFLEHPSHKVIKLWIHGYAPKEIAISLKVSQKTVRNRLNAQIVSLRKNINSLYAIESV